MEAGAESAADDVPDPGSSSVLVSLSPSRAADFKACPLRYRFRVIDRLPEPSSPAAVRGTLVHAVLERLFDLPAAERTSAAAHELLAPAWERLRGDDPDLAELFAPGAEMSGDSSGEPGPEPNGERADAPLDEQAWLESAATLLDRYFVLEDPRRIEPHSREEYVEVELPGGLVLRGVIDRLDVAPSGAVRVVDYKTGRSPSELWEGKALFQLKFYALVLWRLRGIVPAVLQLLYLADEQRLTYTPDEAELVAFERQLTSLWQAIERARDSGDFRASKGPLCRFCDHQLRCPEFGGTPPPYPVLAPAVRPVELAVAQPASTA